MNHDEIIKKLAEKHGLPEEQIKLVVGSFWDGLRHYLTHPLEAKDGIIVHNFLSFYIDIRKIKNYIERLKLKTFKRTPKSETSQIGFYEELLQNKIKYERQKKRPVHNQRPSEEA